MSDNAQQPLNEITFSTFGFISRCPVQVFEAIADHRQLSRYFTTGGADGRLEPGRTIMWDFADFPGAFPVHVLKAQSAELISLNWGPEDALRTVNFELEPFRDFTRTKLTITESYFPPTTTGIQEALGSQMGWTGMLAALKVWLEHGIHLREGFYK